MQFETIFLVRNHCSFDIFLISVTHDYMVDDYAYIIRDGNYRKLEGDEQGPYRITEVLTNDTVRLKKGITNERDN